MSIGTINGWRRRTLHCAMKDYNHIQISTKSNGPHKENLWTDGAIAIPLTLKSVQWRSVTLIPTKTNLGPHHRPTPRHTKDSRLQSLPIGPYRRRHSHQVSKWTTTKGLHTTVEIPICIPILLYQEKGQETMTSARLLKTKRTYSQESLSTAPNPRNHWQSMRC